jgi:hypothetical protein
MGGRMRKTGYLLITQKDLAPFKEDGFEPHEETMGFLDFLRELEADEIPFKKFLELRLEGLDEVLFAAIPDEEELALDILGRLKRVAAELERKLISVQVIFKEKLIAGDRLWAEYRGRRLPIGTIFGSPHRQTDANGNSFFVANFNLSSG